MEKTEKTDNVVDTAICEYLESEVDLGYHKNYSTTDLDGSTNHVIQGSCQRISHCSCNCNRCAVLV